MNAEKLYAAFEKYAQTAKYYDGYMDWRDDGKGVIIDGTFDFHKLAELINE